MIVEKMDKETFLKELNSDFDYLKDRFGGWNIKYKKALKNKKIPVGRLLDTVHYTTPRYNKVDIYLYKADEVEVGAKFIFRYSTDNGVYYVQPNTTTGKIYDCDIYSHHFLERLELRYGIKGIDELMEIQGYKGWVMDKYDYNGLDQYAFNIGNYGLGFSVPDARGWGFMATTCVDFDCLYDNQKDLMIDLSSKVDGFWETMVA